jgi:hypothetical protein
MQYLGEKLRLFRMRKILTEKGYELSEENKRKKRANDKMKVEILNEVIFPSMANLIVFLEFIEQNALTEEFEDDIKELLLPVFTRFIKSSLHWNYDKDPQNWRLLLLHAMQEFINYKIKYFASKDYTEPIQNMLATQLDNMSLLLKLYTRGAILEEGKTITKTVYKKDPDKDKEMTATVYKETTNGVKRVEEETNRPIRF